MLRRISPVHHLAEFNVGRLVAPIDSPDLVRPHGAFQPHELSQRDRAAHRRCQRRCREFLGILPVRAANYDVPLLDTIEVLADEESVAERPDDPRHCGAIPPHFGDAPLVE